MFDLSISIWSCLVVAILTKAQFLSPFLYQIYCIGPIGFELVHLIVKSLQTWTLQNYIQEGLIPSKYFEKSTEKLVSTNGTQTKIKYELNNAYVYIYLYIYIYISYHIISYHIIWRCHKGKHFLLFLKK